MRITHLPTGLVVTVDARNQKQNEKVALKELEKRIEGLRDARKATLKKAKRDDAIHNTPIVRTYNFKKGTVKDHRTKKTASLKDVLKNGKIDLLR